MNKGGYRTVRTETYGCETHDKNRHHGCALCQLREAVMLLFDWDAFYGNGSSVGTETKAFLVKIGYDPMTATIKKRCPWCGVKVNEDDPCDFPADYCSHEPLRYHHDEQCELAEGLHTCFCGPRLDKARATQTVTESLR